MARFDDSSLAPTTSIAPTRSGRTKPSTSCVPLHSVNPSPPRLARARLSVPRPTCHRDYMRHTCFNRQKINLSVVFAGQSVGVHAKNSLQNLHLRAMPRSSSFRPNELASPRQRASLTTFPPKTRKQPAVFMRGQYLLVLKERVSHVIGNREMV